MRQMRWLAVAGILMMTSYSRLGVAEAAEVATSARAGNIQAEIARWYEGKQSAISVQFEGSDPSQLATGIPVINRYGRQPFVGTFFPDPASESYQANRAEWDKAIRDGHHEFGPAEMKAPRVLVVGSDPAQADVVGLAAFRQQTDENVTAGGWMSLSFHEIGPQTGLGVSEQTFREMMFELRQKRYRWRAWIGGVAQVAKYQVERDASRVSVEVVSPTKMKIEVTCGTDPAVYDQPLTLQVRYRQLWDGYEFDVQVLDDSGQPIPATRQYSLGPDIYVSIPPRNGTYYVQATNPRQGKPPLPPEAARSVSDPVTGLTARVCRWYDNRRAAVSFRFDDSHPTHILTAVPILREYGFKGSFYINPSGGYRDLQAQWEACAAQGDQEFDNHTLHHDGAVSDDDAEREIGEAAEYIRSLFPHKGKLMALGTGGGTVWTFSRPFRYFLDKYSLFIVGVEISMTEEKVEAYRTGLDGAIRSREVFTSLYHVIDKGGVTPETFRRVLEITKERSAEIWVAGVADVQKYQDERAATALALRQGPGGSLTLAVTCGVDRELYDQPLTIELALPDGWPAEALRVKDRREAAVTTRVATANGRPVVRFDVPPTNAEYLITR